MKRFFPFILLFVLTMNTFGQEISDTKNINSIVHQLEILQKKNSNLINTGMIITTAGIVATSIGILNFAEHTKDIIVDSSSGQLSTIINNQAVMNKTIPSALLATTGIIVAGIGTSIMVKGYFRKSEIDFQLKTISSTPGLGISFRF